MLTGRYMSLALRTARIFWLKRIVKWPAVRPAPLPPGTPSWCHGFCQRENKQITIISLQRTTSAKTRATATRRQQHIPPNVGRNAKKNRRFKDYIDIKNKNDNNEIYMSVDDNNEYEAIS